VCYLPFLPCGSFPDTQVIVPGHTILPSILDGLKSINDTSDPIKLVYQAISYKPFISLFNLTGVASANQELTGIGLFWFNGEDKSAPIIHNHSQLRGRCCS
jgi:hypothetical protein